MARSGGLGVTRMWLVQRPPLSAADGTATPVGTALVTTAPPEQTLGEPRLSGAWQRAAGPLPAAGGRWGREAGGHWSLAVQVQPCTERVSWHALRPQTIAAHWTRQGVAATDTRNPDGCIRHGSSRWQHLRLDGTGWGAGGRGTGSRLGGLSLAASNAHCSWQHQ